jgi:hypothetical protein
MSTRDNVHPITDADLDVHRETAEFRLRNVGVRGTTYDLAAEVHKLPGWWRLSADRAGQPGVARRAARRLPVL